MGPRSSAGKLREWQALLRDLPFTLLTLRDVGINFDVDETGTTFVDNARLKASVYISDRRPPSISSLLKHIRGRSCCVGAFRMLRTVSLVAANNQPNHP